MTSVRMRVNDVSMSYANRAFVVIFSIDKNENSPLYWKNIEDISSPPMLCVRHRLSLNTDMADKWYKDEGGKDNRMDLTGDIYVWGCVYIYVYIYIYIYLHIQIYIYTVNLLSANGCHVSGRRVPLKIFLMYENGQQVLKQEVCTNICIIFINMYPTHIHVCVVYRYVYVSMYRCIITYLFLKFYVYLHIGFISESGLSVTDRRGRGLMCLKGTYIHIHKHIGIPIFSKNDEFHTPSFTPSEPLFPLSSLIEEGGGSCVLKVRIYI
jgi:hypothetical protein